MNDWKKNPNKKALAIIRRSSHGQKDNTSADTQMDAIKAYALRNGLEFVVEPEAIVETAYNSKRRDKYNRIIESGLKLGAKHLLFYDASRESRNQQDLAKNTDMILKGEIIVHHVSENRAYWTGSSNSDLLLRGIGGVINENYSRENGAKMKAAYRTKAENGWFPFRHTPLGYIHFKKKDEYGNPIKGTATVIPDPDPSKVRLVRREFELRAQGYSYEHIHQTTLAENLVPTSLLKTYSKQAIEKRLKNPLYRGHFFVDGIRYEGKHELIVSSKVLAAVDESFKPGRAMKKMNGLSSGVFDDGWLRCGHPECARQLTFDPKTKTIKGTGEKKIYSYYRCTNSRGVHETVKSITEEKLWAQFEPAVDALAVTHDFAQDIANALNETQLKQQAAIRKQMEGFRAELEGLRSERANAVRLYASHKIKEHEYNSFIADVERREDHYVNELERLNLSISDAGMTSVKQVFELAINAKELWKSMDKLQRLEYLKKVSSNPTLDDLTVRFELKKPFLKLAEMKQTEDWRRE